MDTTRDSPLVIKLCIVKGLLQDLYYYKRDPPAPEEYDDQVLHSIDFIKRLIRNMRHPNQEPD